MLVSDSKKGMMQKSSAQHAPLSLFARLLALIAVAGALLFPITSCESANTAPEPQTVVCLGDSITYGLMLSDPSQEAWPALLESKLGDASAVVNLGVSGATLMDEGALPYRNTGAIQLAKEQPATVLFIMLGTNDVFSTAWSEDSYYTQLSALVGELEESRPEARIVLMVPPCAFSAGSNGAVESIAESRIGGSIRNGMRSLAAEKATSYVDLFALTEGHPEWFVDGLHPNKDGHQAIADYIYQEVFANL